MVKTNITVISDSKLSDLKSHCLLPGTNFLRSVVFCGFFINFKTAPYERTPKEKNLQGRRFGGKRVGAADPPSNVEKKMII